MAIVRQRDMLIRYAAQHVQHLQKTLEEMNVKLTEVVSDIVGQTGMKILQDIVRGQRDPLKLAKHRHDNCQATEAEIAAGVAGYVACGAVVRAQAGVEVVRVLPEAVAGMRGADRGVFAWHGGQEPGARRCRRMRKRRQKPGKNEVRFGARALLFRMAGVDLTVMEGINETTALVILSEIGHGHEPLSAREEFRELAGTVSATSGQCGEDFQASDAAWRQPCGASVADGGAGLSSRQECVGGVLSADSGAVGGAKRWWRRRGRWRSGCIGC